MVEESVPRSEVTGRAVTEGNHRALLVVAGGVIAILVALAMLSRTEPDDRGSGTDVDQSPSTLPGFFTTTSTIPGATVATAATVSPTTASPTTVSPTTVSPTTMAPGEFVLGEPTGLWLFYGGSDPLQRLDLDTGELVQFGLEAFPLIATGEDVVLYQAESEVVGWVSSAAPGEQALNWKRGPVALGPQSGQLWILDRATDLEHPSGQPVGFGQWELFDTAANRVLERRPGDLYEEVEVLHSGAELIGGRFEALRPGPDYSNRPDGVYQYDDAGYLPLGSGRVVAYDGSLALIADCRTDTDCRYRWLDRESGLELDGWVPDGPVVFAELLAGGRWLHTIDDRSGSELLDLMTGNRMAFERVVDVTISPDGRWLAMVDGGSIIVSDFTGATQTAFDHNALVQDEGGDLLFVERSTPAG